MSPTHRFHRLHQQGFFVMPNPWDRGSARLLGELGFPALATTSAGYARALGRHDHQVTRDELVAHVADLTAQVAVPINVDSELLFPGEPGGITETVRLLAGAGAAGCSIEDYQPATGGILPRDRAVAAVAEAAEACHAHGLVLTARAENHVHGVHDLDDTLARLVAYRDAGADVLYPTGVTDPAALARVVAVGTPVNVLALPGAPDAEALRALGVRRMSTGSSLFNAAYATLRTWAGALGQGDVGGP